MYIASESVHNPHCFRATISTTHVYGSVFRKTSCFANAYSQLLRDDCKADQSRLLVLQQTCQSMRVLENNSKNAVLARVAKIWNSWLHHPQHRVAGYHLHDARISRSKSCEFVLKLNCDIEVACIQLACISSTWPNR